jgi:hypothetical protein
LEVLPDIPPFKRRQPGLPVLISPIHEQIKRIVLIRLFYPPDGVQQEPALVGIGSLSAG